MAHVAAKVIEIYAEAYPEVKQSENLIFDTLTREEQRFAETLDTGFAELNRLMAAMRAEGQTVLDGKTAFNLYATLGFPLEITRDILTEEGFSVDEAGFTKVWKNTALPPVLEKLLAQWAQKMLRITN